ncbi:MAG: biopolymer transporter ExbD [Desulfurellaceae bacterium]|nr:biopolymer transporter ExbD [Desulfurellaceae bacterium]
MNTTPLYAARRRAVSLTALIDVVFILLMFFMLTSTFSRWKAVDFHFPVAGPELSSQQPQTMILHENGALSLNGQPFPVPPPDGPRQGGRLDATRPVVVFPEAETRLQTIISVFEQLQAAGSGGVSLGKSLERDTQN